MLFQFGVWVLSLIVAGSIGFALSTDMPIKQRIRNTLISASIGTIFITVFQLQFELKELRQIKNEMIKPNSLAKLNALIEKSSNGTPMLSSIIYKRDKIETEIVDAVNGKLSLVGEDEVIYEWTRMFKEAGSLVYATNYVSPDFWISGSEFSSKQFEIQKNTINAGVTIRRIFIYNDSTEIPKIKQLALKQKNIGIDVRLLKRDKLESMQTFIEYRSEGGSIDFVIFDLNIVLLTHVDEQRNISIGYLTKTRNMVDNAQAIFNKIWPISEVI
jgi:hypothetical protein